MYISYITKKKFLSLLLACSLILVFIPRLSPTIEIQAATNYQNWKQYDSQWGSLSVGNSTMAGIGCKITSLAILMVHSGAESASNFNPGTLRNRFVNGGFIGTYGDLADAAVSRSNSPYFYYVGDSYYPTTPFSGILSEIKSLLNQGYYIEVSVNNNGHRVAVNYCTNNEVYIMDPGSSRTTLSSFDGTIHHINYYKAVKRYSATPVEDTLTLTNYNYPSMLASGQSFSITGTVTSAVSNITSLTVGVYDYNGNFKTGKTVYPNTTSYNLVNIDPYVKFGSLAKDGYYYQVTATNAKGTVTLLKRSFLVGVLISSDQLTLTGYNYPTTLKVGQSFSITGTITSAETNIQKVTVEILDMNDNEVISKSAYPNAKTYNLKNIDAQVRFGTLAKGTYYYCVSASNKNITTFFPSKKFTVS